MTRRRVVAINPYHYRVDNKTIVARLSNLCVTPLLLLVVAGLGDALAATVNPFPSAPTTSATTTAACAPLPAPANGIVAYSTPLGARQFAPPGTLARTACLAGYELIVPSNNIVARITAQCTSSGQWNSTTAMTDGQQPPMRCALNVALGMPTLLSSTVDTNINNNTEHPYETTASTAIGTGGGGAWLAVDGSLAFCAKTQLERQPWWQVQLDRPYSIGLVKVTLGGDMTDQQQVEVLLTNTSYATPSASSAAHISCAVVKSLASVSSASRQPQHLQNLYADCSRGDGALQSGQYIVVRAAIIATELPIVPQRLHLCEVQVFSDEAKTCSHPGNPRNGLVKLSSDTWPYVPGTQAVYECDEGYTRLPFNSAHFHRRCQPNGEWTEQQPTCEMDVALYKFTRQGSNFSSNAYPAWHAVDGDPTTCSWTRRESNPWILIDLLDTYEIKALAILLDKERLFYDFHRKNLELAFFNTTTDLAINAALAYANANEQARQNIRRLSSRQNRAATYAPLFLTAADIGYEFLEFAQIDLNSQGSGIFVMQRPVTARSVLITPSSFGGSSLSPKYLGVCDIKVYTSSAVPPVANRCGAMGDGASSAFLYTRSNTASSTCLQVERYHSATWDGAMHACATRGGSLLKQIDRTAQAHVGLILDHLYRFHDTADAYWIGARRRNIHQIDGGESQAALNALVSAQPWQWVSSVNTDTGNANVSQTILPNDFTFWNNPASAMGGSTADAFTTTVTGGAGEVTQCAAMGGDFISDWSWANYRCSREANWICEYPVRGCSSPQLPSGVLIDRTFYEYLETGKWESGDELQLVCEPGHVAKAERNLKCEPSGLWSGVAECKAVDCGPPPALAGAYFLLLNGTTTYGSKAHYLCVASVNGLESPAFAGAYAFITCGELGWQSLTLSCGGTDDEALDSRSASFDVLNGAANQSAFTPPLPKSTISQQQPQRPTFMFADPNEVADVGGPNFRQASTSVAVNTPPSWLPPRVEMKTVTPLPHYTRHIITSTTAITTADVADDADPISVTDGTTTPSNVNSAVVIIPTSNTNQNAPEQQLSSRMAPSSAGGGLSVGGGIAIGFGTALLLMLAIVGLIWQFARQVIADKFGIFITGPAIGGGSSDTSSDRHAASSNHHSNSTAADSVSHQQQFHHLNQLGGVQILAATGSSGGSKPAFHLLAPPLGDYRQHQQHFILNDDGSATAAQYASAVIMLSQNNPHNMGTIRLARNVVTTSNENDDRYSNANNALESHYYASHTYATAAAALATTQQQQQEQFEDDETEIHHQLQSGPQSSFSTNTHPRKHLPENSFSDANSSSGSSSPRQIPIILQNVAHHTQLSHSKDTQLSQSNYGSATLGRHHHSAAPPPPPPPPLPLPMQLSSTATSTPVQQHQQAFMTQPRDSAYNSSLSGESISGSHHHRHLQLTPLSPYSHYDVVGHGNPRPPTTQIVSISRKPSSLLSASSAVAVSASTATPGGRKPLAGGVPVLPQIRSNTTKNNNQHQHSGSNIIHAFGGNSSNEGTAITVKPVAETAVAGARKLSKPYQRPQAYHTTKERRSDAAIVGGAFSNTSAFWQSPSTTNINDEMMPRPSRAGLLMSSTSTTSPSNRQQPQYVKTLGRTAMQKLVRKAARALTTTSDATNTSTATTSLSVADLFSAASNGSGPQTNPNGSGGGGSRCRTPGSAQNLRLMPMISGPIECRKTVLINGGTPHAMPASQVIYATDDHHLAYQHSSSTNAELQRHRRDSSNVEINPSGHFQQSALDSDFADSLVYDCLPDDSKDDDEDVQSQVKSFSNRKQQSDAISSATTVSNGRQPTFDINGSTPGVSEKSLTTSLMEELQRRIKNTSSLDNLSPSSNCADKEAGNVRQLNRTSNQAHMKPARQYDEIAGNTALPQPQQSPVERAGGGTLPKTGGYESEGCYFDDEFEEEIYGSAQRGASLTREQHAASAQQQKPSNLPSPGFSTRQNPVFVTPYMTAYDLKAPGKTRNAVISNNSN